MLLEGQQLIVEPKYPYAEGLMKVGALPNEPDPEYDGAKIRNTFWSWYRRSFITVWERTGKIEWGLKPGVHSLAEQLETLRSIDAWSLETEAIAMETLKGLITERAWKMYNLTGAFLESSPRSKVMYLFRRLRPTIAMSGAKADTRILCALCLHPIAYYSGSWAGAMCPTDDVIAHLMLMRGDEKIFWRRANQHPAWSPAAGI